MKKRKFVFDVYASKKKKRKPGRPKGSRNKKKGIDVTYGKVSLGKIPNYPGKDKDEFIKFVTSKPTTFKDIPYVGETPTFLSRLEAATVRYEQAIKETIEALKNG